MELHLSPKVISKGPQGRTACGSAAYRSCSSIVDNDGVIHNFKYKKGHVDGGIELPAGAPEELRDPQTLWQRHEIKDIRKDAQLYRDIEFAFPNEFSYSAVTDITKKLCSLLTDKGMCVQWDIHDNVDQIKKTGKPRNLHVHMMVTMRELQADGTFGNKNRSWNKYNGGLNIADLLRPEAARLMNDELARIGSSERVEHESYAARGIDKVPQIHVGVSAYAMEEKGVEADRFTLNEEIKKINKEHISYLEKLSKYREARAKASEITLLEAKEQRYTLEDRIRAMEDLKTVTGGYKALEEPSKPLKEQTYQSIKVCNQQIYALKKDKERTKNVNRALHLIKNLAGDPALNVEQEKQLEWAVGYLKWAGMESLAPEAVHNEIDKLRENNTQRVIELHRLQNEKQELYNNLSEMRKIEWEQKKNARSQTIEK